MYRCCELYHGYTIPTNILIFHFLFGRWSDVINCVWSNSSLSTGTTTGGSSPPAVRVVISTGSNCVSDCTGKADGDYQSCTSCNVYVTCSNERLIDNRPCAPSTPALVWDDNKKRCEYSSPTWYVTH